MQFCHELLLSLAGAIDPFLYIYHIHCRKIIRIIVCCHVLLCCHLTVFQVSSWQLLEPPRTQWMGTSPASFSSKSLLPSSNTSHAHLKLLKTSLQAIAPCELDNLSCLVVCNGSVHIALPLSPRFAVTHNLSRFPWAAKASAVMIQLPCSINT